MFEAIRTFVENHITGGSDGIRDLVILFFIAICALGMYYVTRALLRLIERIVLRTPTSWDDDLFNSRFLGAVSQLSPALVVKWMLPGFFGGDYGWLGSATSIYIVGAVVWILIVFIQNVYNGISHRPSLRAYAVKGVFQMVQLVLICVAVVYSVSIMVGKSPVAILTALGASAAVLMLVFKDTILGLVASVQLTANKMIQRGDWIVCEKHDADGEVVDISLTTVKVRNWDNSITTIPPYVLISESFRNYEPMRFSGGRRVCRSILIDANSVGFCSSAQLEGLREQGWLHGIGIEEAARVVNLQLLRLYLEYWLMHDSRVNSDMVVMARQMPPTPQGLPLQLYFFCREVRWKQFEAVQSDIFDHIYAVIGLFGLRIFQSPAGADFAKRPTMTPTDKAPQVHPWGERPNPFAMTIGSGRAFVLLVCVFVVCYLLTAATVYLVTKLLSGNEAAGLRIGAIVQDILLFVLPALATALLASRRPAVLLGVTTPPGVVGIMLAIAILFVSVPAMEAVIYWNWHWDWLGPELEAMARRMEDSTAATLRLLMGNGSVMALVVNILIVGVAAGFAEELFFRGGMLRILLAGRINSHLAVWLVAVIFSALHFQPFGLVPRILLGAYFGYLLLWSRSVWLPMFAHMLNNITYVVTAWSEVRREGAVALDKEPELWSVYATVGSAVATAALIWFLFSHFRGDKTELSGCRFGSTGQ